MRVLVWRDERGESKKEKNVCVNMVLETTQLFLLPKWQKREETTKMVDVVSYVIKLRKTTKVREAAIIS